jgi:hypothetical protein
MYEELKLTAVECPVDLATALPKPDRVREAFGQLLVDLGKKYERYLFDECMHSEFESGSRPVINDFRIRERNDTDPLYSLDILKESVFDLLGLYRTDFANAEVVLYIDSCMRAAQDIGVKPYDLLQVVVIHELAHHATAWGRVVVRAFEEYQFGGVEYRWKDYNECHGNSWTGVHEFFAQSLTFVHLVESNSAAISVFRRLSLCQPSVYRTWEVLDAFTQNGVGIASVRDWLQAQFLTLMRGNCKRRIPQYPFDVCDYDS